MLPYYRFLHYQHAALRANDVWTIPPGGDEPVVAPEDQLSSLMGNWTPPE